MKVLLLLFWVLASTWILMLFSNMLYNAFKGKGVVYAFLFGCMLTVMLIPASIINILVWHILTDKHREFLFNTLWINKTYLDKEDLS